MHRALEGESEPIDIRDAGRVKAREDLDFVGILRGCLGAAADGVAELPEVVVIERGVQAERRRIRAVAVVEFQAAVERERVLDVEIDIHRPGEDARLDDRGNAPIRKLIEADEILLGLGKVDELALGKRGNLVLDFVDIEIA